MAFVKLEKRTQVAPRETNTVRMGAHRTAAGKSVYIAIGMQVAQQVGWTIKESDYE